MAVILGFIKDVKDELEINKNITDDKIIEEKRIFYMNISKFYYIFYCLFVIDFIVYPISVMFNDIAVYDRATYQNNDINLFINIIYIFVKSILIILLCITLRDRFITRYNMLVICISFGMVFTTIIFLGLYLCTLIGIIKKSILLIKRKIIRKGGIKYYEVFRTNENTWGFLYDDSNEIRYTYV